MDAQPPNTIFSGIEPVDELMGGLERGGLYFVHGETVSASLFGIKFLIEGLKRNENSALVIRHSPEEAVRRFAQLGYDCLEDVYSGRLVILEYSDDVIQKIGKLRELTPVLRELEWLLGETRPERLIIDPVTNVLAGSEGDLETRAREFAQWARSLSATVVLIAEESDREVAGFFRPLVAESFRFDAGELRGSPARFVAFEKSETIPDHAVDVDPSRGIFLLGRPQAAPKAAAPQPPSVAELESIRDELRSVRDRIHRTEPDQPLDIDLVAEPSGQIERAADTAGLASESSEQARTPAPPEHRETLKTHRLTPLDELEIRSHQTKLEPVDLSQTEELDLPFDEPPPPATQAAEAPNELQDLLDDLNSTESPLDLDLLELKPVVPPPGVAASATSSDIQPAAPSESKEARGTEAAQAKHGRAADLKIDSVMAKRAAELLLTPPAAAEDQTQKEEAAPRSQPTERPQPLGDAEVQAKDFNVLIIEDDAETCENLIQTLAEYTLEVVHDGMSGLAKLLAFKPDLVVLGFDLPIIDGFKILRLVRSALNVPVIIVSGSRMRAIDRVMASEIGADYFVTKPFSTRELKHKARQLIARYRGIDSWIVNPPRRSDSERRGHVHKSASASEPEPFAPYHAFEAAVEKRVREAKEGDPPFSVLGCALEGMTAAGGALALRLFEIVHELKRETDVTSTNLRNELVVLLQDADSRGARAFADRLRLRVMEELNREPALWVRSFPILEEAAEAASASAAAQGAALGRRSSDKAP